MTLISVLDQVVFTVKESSKRPVNPRTGKKMQRMYNGRFASNLTSVYTYRPSVRREHVDWRERVCESCHKAFSASRRDARFCSQRCRQRSYRLGKRSSIVDLLRPDQVAVFRELSALCPPAADAVKRSLSADLLAGRYALEAIAALIEQSRGKAADHNKSILAGLRLKK